MNDLFELKLENNRLKNELQFGHSFIDLLEDYRQLITNCLQKCDNCQKNEDISAKFRYLETIYTKHQEFARNHDPKQYQFNSMANNGRELVVGYSGETDSLPKKNHSQSTQYCHPNSKYGNPVIGNTSQEIKSKTTHDVFSDDNDSDFDPDFSDEDDSEEDIRSEPKIQKKIKIDKSVEKSLKLESKKRKEKIKDAAKKLRISSVKNVNKSLFKSRIPCTFVGCDQYFLSQKTLVFHLKTHTGEQSVEEFVCGHEGCNYKTQMKKCLTSHELTHITDKKFVCSSCDKRFPSESYLRTHVRRMHETAPNLLICGIDDCQKQFKSELSLKGHRYVKHLQEQKYVCDQTDCHYNPTSKFAFDNHVISHSEDRPYKCTVDGCQKTFNSKKKLYRHASIHKPEKWHKCDQCEYSHRDISSLESHKNKVHRGIRPFKCDKCNKDFTGKQILNKHYSNVHKEVTEESLHSCDWVGCEFKTKYMMNLKEHMKGHTGDRPFKCCWPGCDKSYYIRTKLSLHRDKAHKVCYWPGCEVEFTRKGNLMRHMKLHDPSQHKICEWPGCEKSFTREDKLKKHMETHIKSRTTLEDGFSDDDNHSNFDADSADEDDSEEDKSNVKPRTSGQKADDGPISCSRPGCEQTFNSRKKLYKLIDIYDDDLETLRGKKWLNDKVIDFYLNLIVEKRKNDNISSVYAFSCFFYEKLRRSKPESMKDWTEGVDVFANDFIFIPIHMVKHWCLAVINFIDKRIEYYDSLNGRNDECVNALKDWLQAESIDKKKVELPKTEWTPVMVKRIPRQNNDYDCGVFICKYAEFISKKAKLTFSQKDMPNFRQQMLLDINKKLQ